jgi:hypothetical protein
LAGDSFSGAEEREHGPLILGAGFFHKCATAGDEAEALAGGEGACGGVGGEFAEGKACGSGGIKIGASFVENLPEG